MPAYADPTVCYGRLGIDAAAAGDAGRRADVAVLNASLSLAFDDAVNRSWGDHAARMRVVEPPFAVASILHLDPPLTAITSAEIDGTWDGTVWTGGTMIPATGLRLRWGGLGLERTDGGYWSGPVRVTGAWADEIDGDPPADVVAAVTEAVVAAYRKETYNARDINSSFEESEQRPPPGPFTGPLWKAAVAAHKLRSLVIA